MSIRFSEDIIKEFEERKPIFGNFVTGEAHMEYMRRERVSPQELELENKFLKECNYYSRCNKNKGDVCEHPRCQYTTIFLKDTVTYICKRRDK